MNQHQAELVYMFVTKIIRWTTERHLVRLTDVLWKATAKQRAELGHMHGNYGIPLDLGDWGISWWSAACDPLGGTDREGDSQSSTPVFTRRLKRGTALSEVLMLPEAGERVNRQREKIIKEKLTNSYICNLSLHHKLKPVSREVNDHPRSGSITVYIFQGIFEISANV